MQLLPRYLLTNRIHIILNETGHITEYMPVYTRQLELYKGIDNTVQFYMLNADQKPVDISDKSVRFVAYDSNRRLCLDLPADPVKWDDSTVRTGLYQVTVSHNDLLSIDSQYIQYWVKVIDFDGIESLTYSGTHFGNPATAKVSDRVSPIPVPVSVSQFSAISYNRIYDDEVWYTDPVYLMPGINSNDALHTIVIYGNGYVGDVFIEATLENNTAGPNTVWSAIHETLKFDGTEQEPIPYNLYGVYSYIRFGANNDPSEFPLKILIRT